MDRRTYDDAIKKFDAEIARINQLIATEKKKFRPNQTKIVNWERSIDLYEDKKKELKSELRTY